jgi:hypothetical protein
VTTDRAELSRAQLSALRLALLEVVTGAGDVSPLDVALYDWLNEVRDALPREAGWELPLEAEGVRLSVRQLDQDGTRVALSGDAAGLAGVRDALGRARAEMMDSEVLIRLRAPLEEVEDLEQRLRVGEV